MTGPRSRIARHKTKKLRNVKKERRASGLGHEPAAPVRDHAGEIETWIAHCSPDARVVVLQLQRLVARAAPQAVPMMRWSCPSWVADGDVCWVSAHERHVNLGFYRGSELADAAGLLQGTGKGLRHVKLPLGEPLPADALQSLVRAALALDRAG